MSVANVDLSLILTRWPQAEAFFERLTGRPVGLEGMLLLIGMQEAGRAPGPTTKEEKLDLITAGTCAVLARGGYYERIPPPTYPDVPLPGSLPAYELIAPLPMVDEAGQAELLRAHICLYLEGYL